MFTEEQINTLKSQAIKLLQKKFSENNDKEAEILAHQLLKVDEGNVQVIQLLGLIKYRSGDHQQAIEYFEKAISLNPENYENYNNMGLCLSSMGKYQEAIDVLLKALDRNSNLNFVYSNLGLQYRNNKNIGKAIECYKKSIEIEPTPEAWGMLGGCYGELRNLDEAESCFKKSIELDPNHAASHVDLASIYQLRGEWSKSWPEYEWRFKLYEQTKFWEKIYDPSTKWDGKSDIRNKKIIIHSEQGTGDMIHFFRYIKFVKEKGAYVILHCWDSLKNLLEPYVDEIYVKDPSEIPIFTVRTSDFEIPKYDYQCSIMSLPYLLNLDYIPKAPYLDCTSQFNTNDYKDYFKIGIVWAGNPQHPNDSTRSCYLKNFKAIHDLPNVKLFNLQKDMRPRMYRFQESPIDLTEGTEDMKIVDVSEYQTDFEKTAAIIKSMDLIITVDTAILHLAGALGKQTFALISALGDWRWKVQGENNDWYDSVILFRQEKLNQWQDVFLDVTKKVKSHESYLSYQR